MKLTTKGRYGLRALIDLAVHQDEGAVSTQSIAERQELSESYLEQLMRSLKKAELVQSVRGAGGGYRLARPAGEISVGDVLRALEGNLDAVSCPAIKDMPGFGDLDIEDLKKIKDINVLKNMSVCESADLCVTKVVWKRINDAIAAAVDSMMLDELVNESRSLLKGHDDEVISCKN